MTFPRRVKCEKCDYAEDIEIGNQAITEYLKNNSCPKCQGTLQAELDENKL